MRLQPRASYFVAASQVPKMAKKAKPSRKKSDTTPPKDTAPPKKPLPPPPPETENYKIGDPGEFARNMVRVGIQSQRLLADFVKRQSAKVGSEPLDPLNIGTTFMDRLRGMVADPAVVMEAQFGLWRDYMGLWERTARRMMGGDAAPPLVSPAPGDKRFKDK